MMQHKEQLFRELRLPAVKFPKLNLGTLRLDEKELKEWANEWAKALKEISTPLSPLSIEPLQLSQPLLTFGPWSWS